MSALDIARLRELLAAVPCAEEWSHGPVSSCIETSQRGGDGIIYGLTLFEPDEVDEQTLAEAELACAAVNALPELLAIAEAACCAVDTHRSQARLVIDEDSAQRERDAGDAFDALMAAVDAARKAGT